MRETFNKLEGILSGWANLILFVTKEEAIRRSEICAACDKAEYSAWLEKVTGKDEKIALSGYKCTECGCPISAKVRSNENKQHCPLGKW